MSKTLDRGNWVVISGLVREPEVFKDKLKTLIKWRSQGLIDGIVYSTWIGELDKYEDISKLIEENGILIVEVKEPNLRVPGHMLHQMKAIHYGIEACPEDSYIFKIRPDLGNLVKDMRQMLSGKLDLTVNQIDGWPKIFQQRIVIMGGVLLAPFHLHGLMFYGKRNDVKRLIHFDLSYEILFADIAAEQWFYANPFLDSFQIFKSYFCLYKSPFFKKMSQGQRYIDYCLSSPFMLKVLMTYILILSCYFRVRMDMAFSEKIIQDRKIMESIPYSSIFQPNSHIPGIRFDLSRNTVSFGGEVWIHALLERGFKNDEIGEKIYQALEEVKKWYFHRNWFSSSIIPNPEIKQLYHDLKTLFPSKISGIAKMAKLLETENTTKFIINSKDDRFEVVNNKDMNFQNIEEQRLSSRRLVSSLRQELKQKSYEMQQLKQELEKYQFNQEKTIKD